MKLAGGSLLNVKNGGNERYKLGNWEGRVSIAAAILEVELYSISFTLE